MNEDIYYKIKLSPVHSFLITILKNTCFYDFSVKYTVLKPLMKLLRNISEIDELLDLFVWPVEKKEGNSRESASRLA